MSGDDKRHPSPQARVPQPEASLDPDDNEDDDAEMDAAEAGVGCDIASAAQFLRLWTQVTDVLHVTLVAILPDTQVVHARTFPRSAEDAACAWIADHQATGRNIYFQPNETRPDCSKKPGKSDMIAAVCRFADVDPDDAHFPLADERERLNRLAASLADSECPPTVIIDSGSGLQPIWAVAREALTPEVTVRVEAETAALERSLGAGGTHNIDRLLRMPGTLNFPNQAKLAKGRGITQARLIFAGANLYQLDQADSLVNSRLEEAGLMRPKPPSASTAGHTVDPPEVAKLIEKLEQAQAAKAIGTLVDLADDLQARFAAAMALDPETMTNQDYARRKRLADRWAGMVGDLTATGRDDSRSGADMSLAAMLKGAGFTPLDTALILLAFKHGKANNEEWGTESLRLRHVARSALRSHERGPARPPPGQASGADGATDTTAESKPEPDEPVSNAASPPWWRSNLIRSDKGKILPILANALAALRQAPVWQDVFAWNEFASRLMVMRHLPGACLQGLLIPRELTEADISKVTDWLQHHGIGVPSGTTLEAIRTVADGRRFHPVREYLNRLVWDQKPRLDRWLIDHLGAEETPLNRAFGAKWPIGCVARIMRPGCKLDTALILESRQGLMKSTALATLGYPWFTDHMPELGSKDAMQQLQGVWIIELAELSSLGRAETHRVKAFLSTTSDRFRPSYGRVTADHPRQCGFSGSINPSGSGYLRDETGNRRFWCVKCGVGWTEGRRVDIAALAAERDQLWAEAVHRYRQGEQWWLDSDTEAKQEAAAEERFEDDSREFIIRNYLRGRSYTRMTELFGESCLNIPTDRQTRGTQIEIGRIMAGMKWQRRQRRDKNQEREWVYLKSGTKLEDVKDAP